MIRRRWLPRHLLHHAAVSIAFILTLIAAVVLAIVGLSRSPGGLG